MWKFSRGGNLRFCHLCENYPHAKIKPMCLYEENRSCIMKITPMWKVLPTFLQNFPIVKITTFTVLENKVLAKESPTWFWTWCKNCKNLKFVYFLPGGVYTVGRRTDRHGRSLHDTHTEREIQLWGRIQQGKVHFDTLTFTLLSQGHTIILLHFDVMW